MPTMTTTDGGRWLLPIVMGIGTGKIIPGTNAQVTLSTSNKFIDKDIDINIQADLITPTFDGGVLSGSSTATGTNITLSSTDNGIKIQTAYTAASTAVLYNGEVNGWVNKPDNTQALAAQSKSTTNGTVYYVTAVTVPANKTFSVTTNGTTTVTSGSATTGNLTVSAYNSSGTAENNKTIVSSGKWVSTTVDATGTYYGRVTINVINGTIGGTANNGQATAAIAATSYTATGTANLNTSTTAPTGTAGIDYWQIKATATGTAGSYIPKYTVNTAGWLASTVNGTAQTVSVTSDSTGKSLYIPKATFTVSGRNVNVSTAGYIASGTVGTISNGTIGTSDTDPGNGYTENTTAVLSSGGYLTLTAGYYSATKISLATLVPNGSNVAGHADYLLEGKTAYDNNGILVTGNIATYEGEYSYST